MKQLLFSVALAALTIFSASAQQVQFTIVATDGNNIQLYIRPNAAIGPVTTGISNLTFVLQVPQGLPDPDGQWVVTPNNTYLGAVNTTTTTSTANGPMYNTLFSFTSNPNISGTTFAANTEYLLATIATPAGIATTDITLTDWGNNRIDNAVSGAPIWATSLAIDGLDVTNDAVIFYGNTSTNPPVNGGTAAQQSTLSIGTPLAVHLLSFNGRIQGNDALLEWSVTAEENMDRYEVQYSTQPSAWLYAGEITARNSGNAAGKYSFVHTPQKDAKELYYRLKIWDKAGAFTYSNTIRLQRSIASPAVAVYPSVLQSGETINVLFPDTDHSTKYLKITNAAGQVIKTAPASAETQFHVSTSGLTAGTYILINAGSGQGLALSRFVVL